MTYGLRGGKRRVTHANTGKTKAELVSWIS